MTGAPIALTSGEPAGIGFEIALKAWDAIGPTTPFFLIADAAHLPDGADFTLIDDPIQARDAKTLPVLQHDFKGRAVPGQADPANAQGVIDVIARAVDLVTRGEAAALTTLPIQKKALKDGADFAHPGHTEYLAALAGGADVVMMLAGDGLRVVPATIHIPLSDVPAALTAERLETTLRIAHTALRRDFGIAQPRLAVAGLNPHAGEGGAMGHEEAAIIAPVIEALKAEGMDLTGPLSADTMFHPAARARYDAAIAMYHDQALIPLKTIDFAGGVNITLGLPFIRTSPDHGTAFDIAGQGTADPTSLINALAMAQEMAKARA